MMHLPVVGGWLFGGLNIPINQGICLPCSIVNLTVLFVSDYDIIVFFSFFVSLLNA